MSAEPLNGKEMSQRVLAMAGDAFISIDVEGLILEWNPAAERMFGWSADEAIGWQLADVLVPPHLRQAHRDGMARFLSTGVPRAMGQRLEVTAMHQDGHQLPVELTIWPSETEGELYFRAFLHDITDRRRRARHVQAHSGVAQAIAGARTRSEGIDGVLKALGEPLTWEMGTYWHWDPEAETLVPQAIWRPDASRHRAFAELTTGLRFARGEGLPGQVLETGELLWIDDLGLEQVPRGLAALDSGVRTTVVFPIRDSTGVCGVLEFFTHDRWRATRIWSLSWRPRARWSASSSRATAPSSSSRRRTPRRWRSRA